MWLTSYIIKANEQNAVRGNVTYSNSDCVNVEGASPYNGMKTVAPYGIKYNPAYGETGVVIPTETGNMLLGVTSFDEDLEQGELKLFSKGGAEILLKNNGKVYINGTEVIL